jgi:hypothetical protein
VFGSILRILKFLAAPLMLIYPLRAYVGVGSKEIRDYIVFVANNGGK